MRNQSNSQFIFLIFGGAINLNIPTSKTRIIIVVIQTVELEISKLEELLSESTFSLISIDIVFILFVSSPSGMS